MKVDATVISAVATYDDQYRHSRLRKLELSGVYALFPGEQHMGVPQYSWPQTYPNYDKPGVYLVFDALGKLLYVGKAQHLSARLGSHFAYTKDRTGCRIVGKTWKQVPRYVVTVAVEKFFEAPSLEEYLIEVLQPSENIRGIYRR